MRLFSGAGNLFVGNDTQLDLTELAKSQLVHHSNSQQHDGVFTCCAMLNKMVMKRLFEQALKQAELCKKIC